MSESSQINPAILACGPITHLMFHFSCQISFKKIPSLQNVWRIIWRITLKVMEKYWLSVLVKEIVGWENGWIGPVQCCLCLTVLELIQWSPIKFSSEDNLSVGQMFLILNWLFDKSPFPAWRLLQAYEAALQIRQANRNEALSDQLGTLNQCHPWFVLRPGQATALVRIELLELLVHKMRYM